jgi:N-acetyl-anhydromuramyl-L-alanine amidase AmpD
MSSLSISGLSRSVIASTTTKGALIMPRTLRAALRLMLVLTMLLLASNAALSFQVMAQENAPGNAPGWLNQAFQQAAKEFNVPRDLLVVIAYVETHFDDHNGQPSVDNGYGLMHLVENPQVHTLSLAARLLNTSPEVLKTDMAQNIRGGAAILRAYANEQGLTDLTRKDLAEWYPVLLRYSNASNELVASFYADEAFKLLNQGLRGQSKHGETISVAAQAISPKKPAPKQGAGMQSSDHSLALADAVAASTETNSLTAASTTASSLLWVPADSSNYTTANRPSDYPIKYVVIHTTESSFTSAINWFQNPSSNVSAHYVIRSSDGLIVQMVREKDIAWHAGNWTYNTRSIGIEHEAYVSNASWYTDIMYRISAALTRSICLKYGIPMDRTHIIGHYQVPGVTNRTDPGPYWDWTYYMQLVKGTAWSTILDNATSGRFTASSNWSTSNYNSSRYGANYRYTTPQAVSDAAWFKANIPATGKYEVSVWYPASSNYNSATPFVIRTASGNQVVRVNQQLKGGQWVSLGIFDLNAGDYNVVGVSRWSSNSGYIIADAVRLLRR